MKRVPLLVALTVVLGLAVTIPLSALGQATTQGQWFACWWCQCNQYGCDCICCGDRGGQSCQAYGTGCSVPRDCPPEEEEEDEDGLGLATLPDGSRASFDTKSPTSADARRVVLSNSRATPSGSRVVSSCATGVVLRRDAGADAVVRTRESTSEIRL